MSNVGGFAGGLAAGIQSGRDMELRQRRQENDDKQVKWAEEEHTAKVADRDRQEKFRTDYTALQSKYYGEQDQDTQVTSDGGGGNVAPVTQRTKVNIQPGQDTMRDFRFGIEGMALKMRYAKDPDPESMIKASQYVQQMRSTESGKLIMGTIVGDKEALIKLGQSQGFDGATAKFVRDPSKGTFKLVTSAGEKDLTELASYLGADLALKQMREITQATQSSEKHALDLKRGNQQVDQGNEKHVLDIKKGNLQVDEEIPARIVQLKSSARASDASANRSNALAKNVGSGGGSKASKDVLSAVKAFTPKDADGKPDGGAGALIAHIAATAHGGKTATEAASAAAMEYTAVAQGADQWIRSLPKEQRKALSDQAGGDLRAAAIAKMIQKKYSKSAPVPRAGNMVPADDSEE